MELIEDNLKAIVLRFTDKDKQKVWSQVKHTEKYSNDIARWNAFINTLIQAILSEWLTEELDLSQPITWSSSYIWEFVNGTSFSIGDKRIVIIPSETIDNREICVPQEWVDIPKFVPDYYLAVQVIPDEGVIYIWSFTTHLDLKNHGEYDTVDHTYTMLRDDLILDINSFIVSLEVCSQQRESIPALPKISTNEVEFFIQKLSQPSPYLPRLDVDFLKWGAILENEEWRHKLYESRINQSVASIINLSSWLEKQIDIAWKTTEELFAGSQSYFAIRGKHQPTKPDTKTMVQIKNLIEQIKSTSDEGEKQIAAERLGSMGYADKEVIGTLVDIIKTTKNEVTLWTAATSLWMIDPENSTVGAKRGIDLGIQLAGNPLALIVGFLEKSDGNYAVLIQVHIMKDQRYLPTGCRMTVLDETGKIFSEVVARKSDRAIQKIFSGKRGERFGVKISLADSCIGKDFLI